MDSLESRQLFMALPDGFAESVVAEGLTSPTAMAFAPDGRLFVALKGGDLRVIKDGALLSTPFLQVPVDTFAERGLGGVTLDPDFENNHYVYVYYTSNSPTVHNRVSRFTASGDVAVPGSEQVLVDLPSPGPTYSIHNGGSLQFAPDGTLFVAVGDHGASTNAQSMSHPYGKILRINSDGTIPGDNPFYNTQTGLSRAIWATGLRNPFTTAFEPGTGRFFINDVGEEAWEEINIGAPGANYGWPQTEGEFNPLTYPNYTNPSYSYPHPEGFAVTGGAFYAPETPQFPAEYVGKYFFADYAIGWIRYMDPQSYQVSEFATGGGYLVDLDVSSDGSLYYLSRATDKVYKITATQAPVVVTQPQSQLIHNGDNVTFTAAASGQSPLSYQWQRNGQNIVGATQSSYSIEVATLADTGDTFRCVIGNTLGTVNTNDATLTVTDDNPPSPVITAPNTFRAGQTINFAGAAIDLEDGLIPASNMTWEVLLHHNIHTHPHVAPFGGVTGGSFLAPDVGHTEVDIWYRIHLTVTDSAGFVRSTYKDIHPQTSTVTLQTNVPGLSLLLDGQTKSVPTSILGVRGVQRVLTAPLTQTLNGTTYKFVEWSDDGASAHGIVWPDAATTYEATYVAETVAYVSDMEFSGIEGLTPKRDRNIGGGDITIDAQLYPRGLGMLSSSSAIYQIGGQYDLLTAHIGGDDIIGNDGTFAFEVWGDGVKLYDSGVLTGAMPGQDISVDISGVQELKLRLDSAGDGLLGDWGNWADAKIIGSVALAPLPPSDLLVSAPYYNRVLLSWKDRSSNEQGFELQRSGDGGNTYTTIATLGASVTSYIDNGRSGGTQYKYRVRAFNGQGNSSFSSAATVTTPASTLPAGWLETDIGNMQPNDPGNVSFNSGQYTITAGGLGVYSEADSFHFVYRTLIGDGEIVARITDIGDSSWMRAGVMMRESLAPGSRQAFTYVLENMQTGMIWRSNPDVESSIAPDLAMALPVWVKLARQGTAVSGYTSTNGVNWTLIATTQMTASAPLYVGLAATSWYPGILNTVQYDNVSVSNVAPEVTVGASAQLNSQQTAATLAVLASDDGAEGGLTYTWSVMDKPIGADDPVFNINGTNAAKSAIATFSRLGAYALRVTISDGQSSITSDVNVTVNPLLSSILVTPEFLSVPDQSPRQYAAVAFDQFGGQMVPQPTFTWSEDGNGTIDSTGLYVPEEDGSTTITATVGTVSGNATLIIDASPPQAEPITTPAPAPGDGTWTFNVTYVDPSGIDVSTLGNDDIIVMAPDGTQYAAVLLDYTPSGNGNPRTATYRIVLNDMIFDSTDNGLWTVNLVEDSVADINGSGAHGGEIGSFNLDAPFAMVDQAGVLVINGTDVDDSISLGITMDGDLLIELNGDEILVPSDAPTWILVRSFDGDDTLNINASLWQPLSFESGQNADVVNVNASHDANVDLGPVIVNVNLGGVMAFNTTQHLKALNILDGTAVIGSSGAIVVTDTFTLSQAGSMDINSGAMIVHQGELGGWDGGYTELTGMVAYGRHDGEWQAAGITSSAAANGAGMTGISLARAGNLLGLEGSATDTWRGETVTADSIVILYTYVGDADLNGVLNGDDYFAIDSSVLQSGSVFGVTNGDFDYDGDIDGDDYFWIDSTILFAQGEGPL